MRFIKILMLAACFLSSPIVLFAQEDPDLKPNFALGFAGSYGYYNVLESKSHPMWRHTYGYGGGLIVENMYSNAWGLHSGLWYSEYKMRYQTVLTGTYSWIKGSASFQTVTMPLCLLASINPGRRFSINLLAGIEVAYIARSHIYLEKSTDTALLLCRKSDALPFVNSIQFGATGGVNMKFRIGKYTDFFVGGIAEYYFGRLMRFASSRNNPYAFRTISGLMFRTNVFPISDEDDD